MVAVMTAEGLSGFFHATVWSLDEDSIKTRQA